MCRPHQRAMKHLALLLPDLIPGGAQRVLIDLAAWLLDRGWRVSAVILFRSEREWNLPPGVEVMASSSVSTTTARQKVTTLRASASRCPAVQPASRGGAT